MSDGLKAQISTLEELQGRLVRVRQVPPSLLQTGTTEFGAVKAIGEAVLSEPVQTALARARGEPRKGRARRGRRAAGEPKAAVSDVLGWGIEMDSWVTDGRGRRRSNAQERPTVLPRRPEAPVPLEELGAWATAWNAAHGGTAVLRIRGRVGAGGAGGRADGVPGDRDRAGRDGDCGDGQSVWGPGGGARRVGVHGVPAAVAAAGPGPGGRRGGAGGGGGARAGVCGPVCGAVRGVWACCVCGGARAVRGAVVRRIGLAG